MAKRTARAAAPRLPRADALRNRERILRAAHKAFLRDGPGATLDEIARRAKVGPGTLYRHFPTRDALVEAVFHSEVEKLIGMSTRYAETLGPVEALRAWMLLFIEYVEHKILILPALDMLPGGSERLVEGTRSEIHGAFRALAGRAIGSGALRRETDPDDLIRAFIGVFHTTALPGWEASARRIVDLLIEGARAR